MKIIDVNYGNMMKHASGCKTQEWRDEVRKRLQNAMQSRALGWGFGPRFFGLRLRSRSQRFARSDCRPEPNLPMGAVVVGWAHMQIAHNRFVDACCVLSNESFGTIWHVCPAGW